MWPMTRAGQVGQGVCVGNYEGNPTRSCDVNGTWQSVLIPCISTVPDCPAESYGNVQWPQTPAGSSGTGSCLYGYAESDAGPPTRQCTLNLTSSTSSWAASVTHTCIFRTTAPHACGAPPCVSRSPSGRPPGVATGARVYVHVETANPADISNRIGSAVLAQASASSLTVNWTINPSNVTADLVCILISSDLQTFYPVASGAPTLASPAGVVALPLTHAGRYRLPRAGHVAPAGPVFANTTTATIANLNEYQTFGLRLYAGTSTNGGLHSTDCATGFDQYPMQLLASTKVNRTPRGCLVHSWHSGR